VVPAPASRQSDEVAENARAAWLSPLSGAWWWVALGAITVLAAVLRVYDIGANPPGFFADEAAYGYNAYTILHSGRDEFGNILPLFFKSFGEYKLAVYTYSVVPFVAVFGFDEVAVRLTSAVYGVLTVVAAYALMEALFGRRPLSLTAALILAIEPWHIHYSRTGLGEIPTHAFVLTLALAVFVMAVSRPRLLPVAGLLFALSLYSYRAAWVLLPPLLIVLVILYRDELRANWRQAAAGLAIIALACVPILLLLVNVDERAQDRSILSLDLGPWETVRRVVEHYVSYYKTSFLFDGTAESNLRHAIPGFGWVYEWQMALVACGVAALVWRPTRPKLLLLSLLVLYPLPGALTIESPTSANAFYGSVVFALIAAFGLVTVVDILIAIRPPGPAYAGRVLVVVLVLGLGVYGSLRLGAFLDTYSGSYKEQASGYDGWQWGGRAIVERFLEVEDSYDRLWIDGEAFIRPDIFLRFYAPDGCSGCHVTQRIRYQPELMHLYAVRPGAPWFEPLEPVAEPVASIVDPNGETVVILWEVPRGVSAPLTSE
jgi:4-amino-4-deoxy-L-arabinose transferase-like glycosyltransferase